jgi:hypothetical protein
MVKEASRAAAAVLIAVLTALLVLASGPGQATAGGHKHRHRYLPVRCEDPRYRAVIAQTGDQLVAQYNAMGFSIGSTQDVATGGGSSIDGTTPGEACRYVGTRHLKGGVSTGVREGNGFLIDYLSEGEPPFPGETNPAIREYDWKWKELVSNTKKGVMRGTVSGITCTKYSYDGGFSNPSNVQGFPC